MSLRRVAVFHNIAHVGSAWCCAEGIAISLAMQGYEVFDFKNPRTTPPPLDVLQTMDAIVMGAPEWFFDDILEIYGEAWFSLKAIKVAWYAETAYRDDRNFDFARYAPRADLHYFPAAQDAEEFGGVWLPFAADTALFKPLEIEKRHDAAFIGSMYPKRLEFMRQTGASIEVLPQVGGGDQAASLRALVEAYNSIRIFVNMPAYSRLLVTKVTEVMACGIFLVTPELDHPSAIGNMVPFQNRRHLVYYDPARPTELQDILAYYTAHPEDRDAIAEAGRQEVLKNHSMDQRVARMMADAGSLWDRRSGRSYRSSSIEGAFASLHRVWTGLSRRPAKA